MRVAKPKRTEQGLTLIECLAGIVILTIIISAITPPLMIAFASRVQNYRAAQAQKLAQGEIDRVRVLVETGNYTVTTLPKEMNANNYNVDGVPAPTANSNPSDCREWQPNAVTDWCKADINGDGEWDLGVQTFRTPNQTVGAVSLPIAFMMGVRVYTRAALTSGKLKQQPGRETASLGLTAGQSLSLPLVTRYETIVRSDLDISNRYYCQLTYQLKGETPNCP